MTTETPSPLFIPPVSRSLDTYTKPNFRLGIQGAPGTGKTWAALTFPNPIVIDLDNKLGAHAGRKDVLAIPFHSAKFITSELKTKEGSPITNTSGRANNPSFPPNRRDAVKYWLEENASKLTSDQTLVIDSWSSLIDGFFQQSQLPHEIVYTNRGQLNDYAIWNQLCTYAIDIISILRGVTCNVVVTFHETADRGKDGELNGKLRPLMPGQYGDKIAGQFTNWYRQLAVGVLEKPDDPRSKVIGTKWLWQTQSDNLFDACCDRVELPRYVPANYTSLISSVKG